MNYIPALDVRHTRRRRTSMSREPGKKRQRASADDPLFLFGRLLHITEMQAMTKKYGENRQGNIVRIVGTGIGEGI